MVWHEERLLIDGALVPASGGAVFETVAPASEERLGVAADATVDDARRAITAARNPLGARHWPRGRPPPKGRSRARAGAAASPQNRRLEKPAARLRRMRTGHAGDRTSRAEREFGGQGGWARDCVVGANGRDA